MRCANLPQIRGKCPKCSDFALKFGADFLGAPIIEAENPCNYIKCDFTFTQQRHLTTHIRSVHNGVNYISNQCDNRATMQYNLNTCIKTNIKEESMTVNSVTIELLYQVVLNIIYRQYMKE